MRKSLLVLGLLGAAAAYATTTAQYFQRPKEYTYTSFPMYMAVVTQSDVADLPNTGTVRADAAGAVKVACAGNTDGEAVTLTLAAGEVVPCLVRKVFDTGTDAITLHVSH